MLEAGVLVDPDSESALSVRPALPLKTVAEGADAAGVNSGFCEEGHIQMIEMSHDYLVFPLCGVLIFSSAV